MPTDQLQLTAESLRDLSVYLEDLCGTLNAITELQPEVSLANLGHVHAVACRLVARVGYVVIMFITQIYSNNNSAVPVRA